MPKLKHCQKKFESTLEEILPDDQSSEVEVCILCNRGHVDDLLKAGKLFRLHFKGGKGHLKHWKEITKLKKFLRKTNCSSVQSAIQIHPESQNESKRIVEGVLDDILLRLPFSDRFQNESERVVKGLLDEVLLELPLSDRFQNGDCQTKYDDVIGEGNSVIPNSGNFDFVDRSASSIANGIVKNDVSPFRHSDDVDSHFNGVDKPSNDVFFNPSNDIVHGILNDILFSIENSNCDPSKQDSESQKSDEERSDQTKLLELKTVEAAEIHSKEIISTETDSHFKDFSTEAEQIVRANLDQLLLSIPLSDDFSDKFCNRYLLRKISQNDEQRSVGCKRKLQTISNEDRMFGKKQKCEMKTLLIPQIKSEQKNVKSSNFLKSEVQDNNSSSVFTDEELNMSLSVHYFCVLFSTDSVQRGRDDEGVFGFLADDILHQVVTSKQNVCVYCSREGATTCCSYKGCSRRFHFPCGMDNESAFFFYGKYFARCHLHKGLQQGRGSKLKVCDAIKDPTCLCCLEEVKTESLWDRLISPCCGRHFHRNCVQQMALTYGRSHYQCPQCKDKSNFSSFSLRSAIYIPFRDAEWEMKEHSDFYQFQEMDVSGKECSVDPCVCKKGRNFSEDYTFFEILPCQLCGSVGVHIFCGKIPISNPVFRCEGCLQIMTELRKKDEEFARKQFGIQRCFVKVSQLDCPSQMVLVKKSKSEFEGFKIEAPIDVPPIFDRRWNLTLENLKTENDNSNNDDSESDNSDNDISEKSIEIVTKKKRGRPSKVKTPSILSIKKREKISKSQTSKNFKTSKNSQVKKKIGRPPKNPSKFQIGIAKSLSISNSKSKSRQSSEFPTLDQLKQIGKRNCFVDLSRSRIELPESMTSAKVSAESKLIFSPKIRKQNSRSRKQNISASDEVVRTCQWLGCFATFDDDEALLRHVVTHAGVAVKPDALTENRDEKPTERSHLSGSGASGVKKRIGRPRKQKQEIVERAVLVEKPRKSVSKKNEEKCFSKEKSTVTAFYDHAVTRSIEKQNEKASPVIVASCKTPEVEKRCQSLTKKTPQIKKRCQSVTQKRADIKKVDSGTSRFCGHALKNNSITAVSTAKSSFKSVDAVQIRIRSPSLEIVDNNDFTDNNITDKSDNIDSVLPNVINLHRLQETVFVDVSNDSEEEEEVVKSVENNNSAKRQNSFFIRDSGDDSDDDVIVL